MMNKKMGVVMVTAVFLLLIVPVIVAQFRQDEPRDWVAVALDEVAYEDVYFYNEAQAINLGGMLFMPQGEGPFPAVVFVHGSGPSSRENRWVLTITKYLQDNGVAVLVPDKRGVDASEGEWHSISFVDLATDTVAAVHYLKSRDDLSVSRVGVIGNSQGGHISPLIASQSNAVDFVIDLSGTSLPIREQLLYEENHNLRQMGLLPGISNLVAYPAAWSIREVRQKKLWAAIGDFDPLPYWEALEVEGLVLYGRDDTNVPAEKSEALLQALNKSNITVKLYDGSGHGLETPMGQGNDLIRAEALRDILDFILALE